MSVMSPLEDTGELRLFVEEEIRRQKNDPRRPGLLDVIMLAVIIAASVVVTICWVSLVIAPDHYPVEGGRVLLTSGSAACIIAAVYAGFFGVSRVHRRRHEQLMDEIRRVRCGCPNSVDVKDVARRELEIPAEQLHEMTREAFRLGRRSRPAGND